VQYVETPLAGNRSRQIRQCHAVEQHDLPLDLVGILQCGHENIEFVMKTRLLAREACLLERQVVRLVDNHPELPSRKPPSWPDADFRGR